MGKIIVLDEITSNQIAAGEVIERPASVVKELVENSIDAKAKNIIVEIQNGGIKEIKVTDDGEGINKDDMTVAFERHSTSKIRKSSDLSCISSLGFRGEALASIASVSKITLISKSKDSNKGYMTKIEGGIYSDIITTACKYGTSLSVKNLFFNTPARYKFLKKDYTEASHIKDILSKIALAHPEISFKLTSNNKTVFKSPGNSELKSTIYSIYGKEVATNLIEVDYEFNNYKLKGFIGNYNIYKRNRDFQNFFVNGRYVKSKIFNISVDNSFNDIMLKGRKPFVLIHMKLNPEIVDINVHPSKMEIKFSNENDAYHSVYNAIKNSLSKEINSFDNNKKNKVNEEKLDTKTKKQDSSQLHFKDYSQRNNTKKKYSDDIVTDFAKNITSKEIFNKNNSLQNTSQTQKKTIEFDNKEYFKNLVENSRIIGQIFNSYILIEYKENLLLMDQHAAHERILYEIILEDRKNKTFNQQGLLSSITIELSIKEYETYVNNKNFIDDSGFVVNEIENQKVEVSAIPTIMKNTNIKDTFCNFLNELSNKNNIITDEDIAMIACKSAVKANHKLEIIEIKELIKDLARTNNPLHCPHGRPLIYPISKKEIEKNFQRL